MPRTTVLAIMFTVCLVTAVLHVFNYALNGRPLNAALAVLMTGIAALQLVVLHAELTRR